MKHIAFILFFIAGQAGLFAQSTLQVKEITANMSKGMKPGFEVEIPRAAAKEIERDWKRHLTTGTKAKLTETNGEIGIHGLDNSDIAPKPFNMYSVITSTQNGVKLTVWFTYNDTVFFSSKTSNTTGATRYVHDFASASYFLALKSAYHTEREKLEKMKDELEKSIRQQETANLKIAENKRAIARAQDDLNTNNNDQKDAIAAVNQQQAEVNKVRNGNAEIYKAADKELKDLQNTAKKLQDRNEELHKKIDNWTKENDAQERNIAGSKQSQSKTADAIEKQKALIADLASRLKSVK